MPLHVKEREPASPYRIVKERLRALSELEDWLERPMQWLGVLWLGLVILDLVGPPNRLLQWLAGGLWALFLFDFALRFALAPRKADYLKRNVLTAVSLIVPALRILRLPAALSVFRVARGLRLARMVGSVNRAMFALRRIAGQGGFRYVLLLTLAVLLLGSAGIYTFEREVGGLSDFGAALWWTSMMLTTMGSDYWPKTPEGRILAVLLALYAFAVFGYVTATIASFLIGHDPGRHAETEDELRKLRGELAQLRASLTAMNRSPSDG